LVFFASKHVAGLAGQEELLLFLLGFCLVLVEVFLAPGLFLPALLGLSLMFGSLIWAMVDVWPGQEIQWSIALFEAPLIEFVKSLGLAFILGYFAVKIIGKTPMGRSMILEKSVEGEVDASNPNKIEIGSIAICTTELYPSGKVELDGSVFDARSVSGRIEKGEKVSVVSKTAFELLVEGKD
jgi:membrane-bound serine protease (ClpP class)